MSEFNELVNIDIKNKHILLREDLNVPITNNQITNDKRIKAALPTIEYALSQGSKIAILSHLGRPKEGKYNKDYSLEPIALRLSELLGLKVYFEKEPLNIKPPTYENDITLYENTRFLVGEKAGSDELAKNIATNCDVFVMDAFGASHRRHCSTYTLAKYIPVTCGGLLLIKEIVNINKIFDNPKKPVLAIIGGSKVSTKLNILKSLIKKVDSIIVGGCIANTFLLNENFSVGNSLVEKDMVEDAQEIIDLTKKYKVNFPLPIDVICEQNTEITLKEINDINTSEIIKDIGSKTITIYKKFIEEAGTILWNGPVGVFEETLFENGTKEIAKSIGKAKGSTIAGGGDTISAIEKFINIDDIDYISTGGGAFLEFLEGNKLPGIEIIKKL
jgi:phosphoglycerate kinase